VHTLRFVRRARNLGFSLDEIRGLLSLWHDRARASADVKALTLKHVADLEVRIAELAAMRDTCGRWPKRAQAMTGPTARSCRTWPVPTARIARPAITECWRPGAGERRRQRY
jgi:DNA-binding transcriptional MerR regulator